MSSQSFKTPLTRAEIYRRAMISRNEAIRVSMEHWTEIRDMGRRNMRCNMSSDFCGLCIRYKGTDEACPAVGRKCQGYCFPEYYAVLGASEEEWAPCCQAVIDKLESLLADEDVLPRIQLGIPAIIYLNGKPQTADGKYFYVAEDHAETIFIRVFRGLSGKRTVYVFRISKKDKQYSFRLVSHEDSVLGAYHILAYYKGDAKDGSDSISCALKAVGKASMDIIYGKPKLSTTTVLGKIYYLKDVVKALEALKVVLPEKNAVL